MAGVKNDKGKIRFSLLHWPAIVSVVKVLEMGAARYGDHNWREVENWRQRYGDALMRHWTAYWTGEKVDAESGESHLASIIVNAMFLMARESE